MGTSVSQNGEFHEIPTTFRHYITADASSGLKAEAGRYHLYVAWACPWATHPTSYLLLLDNRKPHALEKGFCSNTYKFNHQTKSDR
jgi:glutathionyl-hydroquinone reductase